MDFEQIKEKIKERRKRLDTPGYNRGTIQQLHDAWLITKIEEGAKCLKCGKGDEAILSVDHIVPKFIIVHFGLDADIIFDEDNLQVLCRRCNQFKGARLEFSNPKTRELLIKYVNMIT